MPIEPGPDYHDPVQGRVPQPRRGVTLGGIISGGAAVDFIHDLINKRRTQSEAARALVTSERSKIGLIRIPWLLLELKFVALPAWRFLSHVTKGSEFDLGPIRNQTGIRIDARTVEDASIFGGADNLRAVGSLMEMRAASRNAAGNRVDVNDVSTWKGSAFGEEVEGWESLANALKTNGNRDVLKTQAQNYAKSSGIDLTVQIDKFDRWADNKAPNGVGWAEIQQYFIDNYGDPTNLSSPKNTTITDSVGLWRNIVEKLETKDGRDLKKMINDYNSKYNTNVSPVTQNDENVQVAETALTEIVADQIVQSAGLWEVTDGATLLALAKAIPGGETETNVGVAAYNFMPEAMVKPPYLGVNSFALAVTCLGVLVDHYGDKPLAWVDERRQGIEKAIKGLRVAFEDLDMIKRFTGKTGRGIS